MCLPCVFSGSIEQAPGPTLQMIGICGYLQSIAFMPGIFLRSGATLFGFFFLANKESYKIN
jgi:undecaprenyl pyrophosphate phosphatase UppP